MGRVPVSCSQNSSNGVPKEGRPVPGRKGPSRTGRSVALQTRGSGRRREADEPGELEKSHNSRRRSAGVMPESLRSCQRGELGNHDLTWVSLAAGLEGRDGSRGDRCVDSGTSAASISEASSFWQ